MQKYIDFGSGYQPSSRDKAESMSYVIEKWLGNPFSKTILKFCTSRCGCGRRIELALKRYAGEDVSSCWRCNIAYRLVSRIIDSIISKFDIERNVIVQNLKDPMWRKGLSSVLEGIAKYGPQKPFTAYAPFLVVWNFTNACNLRCRHCYQNASKPTPDELSTAEALKAVDRMAEAGVAYVAMSGGEPLIRRDFFEVAKRIKDNEMAFSLATNGTLLTKENVKKLADLDCLFIQVSLDGATPETHNSFRGTQSFEKTIQGIKNAVESGITVGIATTVTKHNLGEVPDIINLAEELRADIFMHYNFIPTGRGRDIIALDLSPYERENLLKRMASEIWERKVSLLSTAPQYSRVCGQMSAVSLTHFDTFGQRNEDLGFLAEFVGGCGTGRLYCALQPNGDITPCVFIPLVVGNIKHDDLLEVWHSSEVFKKIRDRRSFVGCGTCKYVNICGGCRARAFGYYGDLQAPDPGCIINKRYWDRIVLDDKKLSSIRLIKGSGRKLHIHDR